MDLSNSQFLLCYIEKKKKKKKKKTEKERKEERKKERKTAGMSLAKGFSSRKQYSRCKTITNDIRNDLFCTSRKI